MVTDKQIGQIRFATNDDNGSVDTYDFKYFGSIPKSNYPNGGYTPFLFYSNDTRGQIHLKTPKAVKRGRTR